VATDLKVDPKNANLGTARGTALLRESIESCGLGRGIVADKHGTVIGGNKTFSTAKALGLPTEVVETTGEELVVVQRTDLDLITDTKARRLAYYDNRVHELDLNWDGRQVQQDALAGVDVGSCFFPEELSALTTVDLAPQDAVVLEPAPDPLQPVVPEPEQPAAVAPTKANRPPAVTLTFNTIEQQLRWGAFMRKLRERYPDQQTPAARLSAYLTSIGIS
jgi:hypothetical protein